MQAAPTTSLEHTLLRMQQELGTQGILYLRRDGQVISQQGQLAAHAVPQMAALLAGMTAASESVAEASGKGPSTRLSLEFSGSGLYAVAVGKEHWVAVFYDDVLNPGLLRMKVRRFGKLLESLESKESFTMQPPSDTNSTGNMTPMVTNDAQRLFENITDAEIENLFRGL